MLKKNMKCCELGTYECSVPVAINGRVREIDYCIVDLVAALNAGGLTTVASCCGHEEQDGRIDLEDGRVLMIKTGETNIDAVLPDLIVGRVEESGTEVTVHRVERRCPNCDNTESEGHMVECPRHEDVKEAFTNPTLAEKPVNDLLVLVVVDADFATEECGFCGALSGEQHDSTCLILQRNKLDDFS